MQCASGKYCPQATLTAVECPAGWYCMAASEPEKCPPGTASGITGQTSQEACSQCAGGSFSAEAASSSCSECAAGSACPEGARDQTACGSGQYCPAGSSAAEACPAGYYCPSHSADMAERHFGWDDFAHGAEHVFGWDAVGSNSSAAVAVSNSTQAPGIAAALALWALVLSAFVLKWQVTSCLVQKVGIALKALHHQSRVQLAQQTILQSKPVWVHAIHALQWRSAQKALHIQVNTLCQAL